MKSGGEAYQRKNVEPYEKKKKKGSEVNARACKFELTGCVETRETKKRRGETRTKRRRSRAPSISVTILT